MIEFEEPVLLEDTTVDKLTLERFKSILHYFKPNAKEELEVSIGDANKNYIYIQHSQHHSILFDSIKKHILSGKHPHIDCDSMYFYPGLTMKLLNEIVMKLCHRDDTDPDILKIRQDIGYHYPLPEKFQAFHTNSKHFFLQIMNPGLIRCLYKENETKEKSIKFSIGFRCSLFNSLGLPFNYYKCHLARKYEMEKLGENIEIEEIEPLSKKRKKDAENIEKKEKLKSPYPYNCSVLSDSHRVLKQSIAKYMDRFGLVCIPLLKDPIESDYIPEWKKYISHLLDNKEFDLT